MRREEIMVSRLVEQRKHGSWKKALSPPPARPLLLSSAFFQSIISLLRFFLYIHLWPFILHDVPIMNHVYSSDFASFMHCVLLLQHEKNQSFQQCLCSVVKTHLPRGKYTDVSAPFSLFFCLDVSSCLFLTFLQSWIVFFHSKACSLFSVFLSLTDTHTHSWPPDHLPYITTIS